ncbi:MAG TPA: FlgO family outer membrane protein, partial [Comamonas sp.]
IRDIASNHSAGLVLVGTYSQATQYTYISLKLVRVADGRIIRSHDYALPNDRDVLRLLGTQHYS